ncbi:helix-turn-helix domain-containing protein [Ferrimicrobium sp.]|uniref:helix-turn-helix domain-containing protein n=1 Tax=Ferrimicrobium sp. TaxID=2926050 RepID=UPI00344D1361
MSENEYQPFDQLLTVSETAQALRLSRATLYGILSRGDLRSVYIGSRRLIRSSDLAAFIANLSSEAQP